VQMSVACWVVRLVTPVTSGLVTMIQPCLATMWSTRPAASGVASLDSAVTSLLPIWMAPWLTWGRPGPEPPPRPPSAGPAPAATRDGGGGAGAGGDVELAGGVEEGLERRRAGGGDRAGLAVGRRADGGVGRR